MLIPNSVDSEADKGSTFSCSSKARRTETVGDSLEQIQVPSFMETEDLREATGGNFPSLANRRESTDDRASQTLLPHSSQSSKTNDQTRHILVVEDNLVNQKVLKKGLSRHGYVVNVANNGIEALEFIRNSEYWVGATNGHRLSVVLMDVVMPIMDGLTCVKKIREAQSRGEIMGYLPIIALTADVRADHIAELRDAGMVRLCFLITIVHP